MTEDTIKIEVYVGTKYVKSTDKRTIDTGVTPTERAEMGEEAWVKLCDALAEQELWNLINWGWDEK